MRWITFLILLYLAAALQTARLCALGGVNPYPRIDYLALLAIFYALYASEEHAPLAALGCGILYDLLAAEPVGMHAVPLALVAWAVLRVRLSIFREHVVSQLIMTILAVIGFGLLTALLRLLLPKLLGVDADGLPFGAALTAAVVNAFYTGLIAPVAFWLLFRIDNLLGFSIHGPRGRGS